MTTKELTSGIFQSLRARCASCGKAMARHASCLECGKPRDCGEQAVWQHSAKGLRCPACSPAALG